MKGPVFSMLDTMYTIPYIKKTRNVITPIQISIPGSKSITNRALLLATLAKGKSILTNCLFSEDSRHFLSCLKDLGFSIQIFEDKKEIHITGNGGLPLKNEASIYVGSAGTAARFLTAYLGLCTGTYHLDSSEQMKKRPMDVLLHCLMELGCKISYTEKEGFFPFTLQSNGFSQNNIIVDIDKSSQFLSALLISSPLSNDDFTITTTGTHGLSYIHMTLEMMKQWGVNVTVLEQNKFFISKNQTYLPSCYEIEPDLSAGAYFYAAGALLNIPIIIHGVHKNSLQGDLEFINILTKMGCSILKTEQGIALYPSNSGSLIGVDVDMSTCSDQAITLAAIAPFATTPTTIRGISHIRYQECNRMEAICTELTRMNIRCEQLEDGIKIFPGIPSSCEVETYEDHRMAMGFSLVGLKVEGIKIKNPSCCKKTFENYFETLESFLREITYTKN